MNTLYTNLLAAILAVTSGVSAFAQEKLKADGEFPVLAWVGVPERETTVERFRELKASGININFSSYSGIEAVEKALDIARQTGVKLMPYCPELKSEPEKTVKRLMKHPALFGYHLRDEPNAVDFPELAIWMKRIQAVDKQHPCYINLFPNYAALSQLFAEDYELEPGKDMYEEHVDVFLKEVPVPFISFDHYPISEKNGVRTLRSDWYKNLEIIAAAAKKSGLPFWAFALSVAHGSYPVATVGEIKLQMYSNLAYGAQALQYFTYWTPGINSSWDFHHAPIGLDGKRTDVYDRIKLINNEIQNLAGVFLNARLVSVAHTGTHIPPGTRRMDKLPAPFTVLETGDNGAVVSVLQKKDRRFLVIVNRDFQNPMKLTVVAGDIVKKVLKDGTMVPANVYTNTLAVDPGDVIIYTWDEK
ncbi:beta-galactosidase [Agriterribacter sp.]|uniref:beta-galactosidase n=1 Tax=Agriterribacter sp. TaxID=2821509 RepID=UPI002CE57C31|nr:beta-galactosidase [Agriterribacter sp.]HRO44781.1 beta-galactosidase [Agriterribacter sp.]HRQ19418.1 beta-galactosidase [Agriterribacter sp.]